MNIKEMTGLEILKAMMQGQIPPASISEIIPMQPKKIEQGNVEFVVKADQRHLNPLGGVHGGFAATVLDTVTGCVVHSALEAGIGYGTIDLNIKMCRPIPKNQDLTAIGHLINISKNLAISEGRIMDSNGKIYAHATATCMIIRA
ncbi:PaaI family thioesterase [Acinetobacter gandensis]|uniref:Phenylacetic acid degradation protein n=1 Tax=Acinetobacter gandensis TaxID=1443941 RepID=A0A1A7R9F1_9GAMM|nr:PaaI family thioesterase [Acinetobacter gandensis]KAB0626683.1 PaaI family thioesterase [Acinetobacter gandensis]OBX28103.1 phenylacetic acid degradation protein [Acinetobacter gandensis]